MRAPPRVCCTLDPLNLFHSMTLKGLEAFVLYMFLGKDASENESARHLQNHIAIAPIENTVKLVKARATSSKTSTIRLLRSYIEMGDSWVRCARKRAFFYLWVVVNSALVSLCIPGATNYTSLCRVVGRFWETMIFRAMPGEATLKSGTTRAKGIESTDSFHAIDWKITAPRILQD